MEIEYIRRRKYISKKTGEVKIYLCKYTKTVTRRKHTLVTIEDRIAATERNIKHSLEYKKSSRGREVADRDVRRWQKNNPDRVKISMKKSNIKQREKLTYSYVKNIWRCKQKYHGEPTDIEFTREMWLKMSIIIQAKRRLWKVKKNN